MLNKWIKKQRKGYIKGVKSIFQIEIYFEYNKNKLIFFQTFILI